MTAREKQQIMKTMAAVVIPEAMAYAAIAGLPLEVGLYTDTEASGEMNTDKDVSPARSLRR